MDEIERETMQLGINQLVYEVSFHPYTSLNFIVSAPSAPQSLKHHVLNMRNVRRGSLLVSHHEPLILDIPNNSPFALILISNLRRPEAIQLLPTEHIKVNRDGKAKLTRKPQSGTAIAT